MSSGLEILLLWDIISNTAPSHITYQLCKVVNPMEIKLNTNFAWILKVRILYIHQAWNGL